MKRILTSLILATSIILELVASPGLAADRTREAGIQAYIYAYPMIMMEITRRVSTNVEAVKGVRAPMNQFVHLRTFPEVVR